MHNPSLSSVRAQVSAALKASPVIAHLRQVEKRWEKDWSRGRVPTETEIKGLVAQGNRSSDWNGLRFWGNGSLTEILACSFEGSVLVHLRGRQTRLSHCNIRDSFIGSANLEAVGRMDRVWVEDDVTVRQVGEIAGGEDSQFGLGSPLHPGSETGSRSVWRIDGLDVETCADMAGLSPSDQKAFTHWLQKELEGVKTRFTWIGSGARIELTQAVTDSYVGSGSIIRGAAQVDQSILASLPNAPVTVGFGAQVVGVLLESGARVDSAAQVSRSLLFEHASVEHGGHVIDSVLGANSRVAKGEITASLLGPLVGFHHQALLIAALWPEGRGNVGYGANVGSNHTGRQADQEIRPGEGHFFGLGCSIKFPANFSEAPYSLFAGGITTLPQHMSFPFSLLTAPTTPAPLEAQGLNEIIPGWMWGENAYALIRTAYKHQDRGRSQRAGAKKSEDETSFLDSRLFDSALIEHVTRSLASLRQAAEQPLNYYLERNIAGLGKNFLRGEMLLPAIAAYENFLVWAAFKTTAPGLNSGTDQAALFEALYQSVLASLAKDQERGSKIFNDYATFHPDPAQDPICLRLRKDLDRLMAAGG